MFTFAARLRCNIRCCTDSPKSVQRQKTYLMYGIRLFITKMITFFMGKFRSDSWLLGKGPPYPALEELLNMFKMCGQMAFILKLNIRICNFLFHRNIPVCRT